MANFRELRDEYYFKKLDAFKNCKVNMYELLRELNLGDKVVRKSDGKIGWIRIDQYLRLCFHPMKKDGNMSLTTSGTVHELYIERDFEPYKEEEQ